MNLTRVKLVTIGEDCSGIGTFGHAMADASRECGGHCIKMWASEKDPALLNVLRASEYNEVHDDMLRTPRNVLPADTTSYGLGSPCQPESRSGKQRRGHDPRSRPLKMATQWLRSDGEDLDNLPLSFVLENVDGMTTGKKGAARFKAILNALGKNFVVKWEKVNARDYVPQNRLRVYLVGIRRDLCHADDFVFPDPPAQPLPQLRDVLTPDATWYSACDLKQHGRVATRNRGHAILALKDAPNGAIAAFDHRASPQRPSVSLDVCPCLMVARSGGAMTLAKKVAPDNFVFRAVDINEQAALQGIPKVHDRCMFMMTRRQYSAALGNAMTYPIVKAIGLRLLPLVANSV